MKFEPWVLYGLIGAVAFGTNVVVYKMGFKGNVNPFLAAMLFSLGIFLTSTVAAFIVKPSLNISGNSALLILLAGIIWSIGSLAISVAFAKNYDVSKIAVLYSSNVIITVLLGMIVLKELQSTSELWRTVIGMLLVVAGVVIVSVK